MLLIFKNKPIFLTHKQLNELVNNVLKNFKEPTKIGKLKNWHSKSNNEKNTLLVNELLKIDEHSLLSKFININLIGDEAINNTYNLIYDFVKDNNNNFSLLSAENKNFTDDLIDDYLGEIDNINPLGKKFKIILKSKKKLTNFKSILKFISNTQDETNEMGILINSNDVKKIEGVFGIKIYIFFSKHILKLEWYDNSFKEVFGSIGLTFLDFEENEIIKPNLTYEEFISGKWFAKKYI